MSGKNLCSIIMYHYVRELPRTRYPGIKGLTVSLFREQLAWLGKYYHFVRARDLMAAAYSDDPLPENAVWLTFDDGYADHYENVFPILDELGIEGAFFIPAKTILEHKVLDVNKIHFLLASVGDVQVLIREIEALLDRYREQYKLKDTAYYFQKLAVPNRFDPKEVIFVKRLLQAELPEELRGVMTDILFKKYVSDDEDAFSSELYMSEEQIRCMARHGMFIGSHGYDHYWWNRLTPEKQADEIDKSLAFLKRLGCDTVNWAVSYPYGAYDDSLMAVVKARGCKLGVTTEATVAELTAERALILPRFDTNDFPKDRNAAFQKVGEGA